MRLVEAILEFNVPYENKFVGTKIGEITWETAQVMAGLILEHAPPLVSFLNEGAPGPKGVRAAVCYLCAVMGQESRFDPHAWNMNLDPKKPEDWPLVWRSRFRKASDPWPPALNRGDYGCAQWSMATAKARKEFASMTLDQVMQKLFDPEWAVPSMADYYTTLLDGVRAKYPKVNPRDAAAGVYNRGPMGFACGYAHHFSEPFPPSATPKHIAKAPDYWKGAERHFTHIRAHADWFQKVLDTTEEV